MCVFLNEQDFIKPVGRSNVPAEKNCRSKNISIKAGKGGSVHGLLYTPLRGHP